MLCAGNSFVRSGLFARAIKLLSQGFVQNVIYQGGLPRTGDSGHDRDHTQRKGNVYATEIVGPRTKNGDGLAIGRTRLKSSSNAFCAGDVLPGQGFRVVHDFIRRSRSNYATSVQAGAGAKI